MSAVIATTGASSYALGTYRLAPSLMSAVDEGFVTAANERSTSPSISAGGPVVQAHHTWISTRNVDEAIRQIDATIRVLSYRPIDLTPDGLDGWTIIDLPLLTDDVEGIFSYRGDAADVWA